MLVRPCAVRPKLDPGQGTVRMPLEPPHPWTPAQMPTSAVLAGRDPGHLLGLLRSHCQDTRPHLDGRGRVDRGPGVGGADRCAAATRDPGRVMAAGAPLQITTSAIRLEASLAELDEAYHESIRSIMSQSISN